MDNPGGKTLLQKIWDTQKITPEDKKIIANISAETMRKIIVIKKEHQKWGGYPPVWIRKDEAAKFNWLKDYRKTYLERDINDVGRVEDINNFAQAQKLLCSRTGQLFSISEVARDLALSVNTIKRYINLLSLSFQCVLLNPYYENIGKRLVKNPKIYFPDVGLNKVILGEMGIASGAFYETWVFSELIKWKELQDFSPEIYFYRTGGGMEIDFIIKGKEMLLPIEVKSSSKIDSAQANNLENFLIAHKNVKIGIIIYQGTELVEVRKNIWAIPDCLLFYPAVSF
jgi:predicted AAA+ superfamily ATPase